MGLISLLFTVYPDSESPYKQKDATGAPFTDLFMLTNCCSRYLIAVLVSVGVDVRGLGVTVAVGLLGVRVAVLVGGTGVLVAVDVGRRVAVAVLVGVLVSVDVLVAVYVLVGEGVFVDVAVKVGV